MALLRRIPAPDEIKLAGDQAVGVNIVKRALEEPIPQIVIMIECLAADKPEKAKKMPGGMPGGMGGMDGGDMYLDESRPSRRGSSLKRGGLPGTAAAWRCCAASRRWTSSSLPATRRWASRSSSGRSRSEGEGERGVRRHARGRDQRPDEGHAHGATERGLDRRPDDHHRKDDTPEEEKKGMPGGMPGGMGGGDMY